jgi:hypothetical protein
MKNIPFRLLLAVGVTAVAFALGPLGDAQQADETPKPGSPHRRDAQLHSSEEVQTQDALGFTGRVLREKGRIVLRDPVTKISYQFDDQSRARRYFGRQVKVTGRLDLNSNTIHIESIEPQS